MRLPVATAAVLLAGITALAGAPRIHELTFLSDPYRVDGIYRSMKGPKGQKLVQLVDERLDPELIWIVGYATEIVSPDGKRTLSPEFMCHNNLNFADLDRHRARFNWPAGNPKLFTLSQGQMEVRFPEGFGIPVHAHQRFVVETQVLNLNPQPTDFDVRHKTTLYFVRDREVEVPMKALVQVAAQSMVTLGDEPAHFNVEAADADHGPGCAVGEIAGKRVLRDSRGNRFAAHWVVKPGREEHRTLLTGSLGVPFDTTIHHIAVHLHPFAESLELRDLTADRVLFRSRTRGPENRIGLELVEDYSSAEGIPFYKDHEYELLSRYDNTTDEDQDAMAVMFLYVWDKSFTKPTIE